MTIKLYTDIVPENIRANTFNNFLKYHCAVATNNRNIALKPGTGYFNHYTIHILAGNNAG